MSTLRIEGRARVFGDGVNTDYIISSRRKRQSLDPQVLRQYIFEEIAPEFAASVRPGDLIVAGKNFGCGSAMEPAVTALMGAGIRSVLAVSFSRTYYRNAVNNGLLPVMCDTSNIKEGHQLLIECQDRLTVRNLSTGEILGAGELPRFILNIFEAGGLVPYFREHGDFKA